MRVLVTSGATREPIDSVRFISNLSSGRTGAAICEALATRGHQVTQAVGTESARAPSARHEAFSNHASLDALLRRLLDGGGFHAVVHAAAVSDYGPAQPNRDQKLASERSLTLRLRPLPKIIDQLRAYAGGADLLLVGFKLTHSAFEAARTRAARELLRRSSADYVVQNDVETLLHDAEHRYTIHARDGAIAGRCVGRAELAAALAGLVSRPAAGGGP
ncbi:MAG: phosphopantothenoylcysteine decarboxylase domain-containing protein [Gammaproteobacteria bacterium]